MKEKIKRILIFVIIISAIGFTLLYFFREIDNNLILKNVLALFGIFFLIDVIRKIWFKGAERDKYEEEREKRRFPTFGS